MKKTVAKISSQLMTENQTIELKLQQQHYLIILPKHLIRRLGIISDNIDFDLMVDDSSKLTLVGPKLGSQPKSVTSNRECGGFVI